MLCPQCNAENRAGARFCRRCGTKLTLLCSQCGAEVLPDAQFCDTCGAALTPSVAAPPAAQSTLERLLRQVPKEYAERLLATRGQPHDERRTVTILFSDIKGSTTMVGQLDPEEAKEIILGAFDFLIAPIFRYEGTLVQLMGDAILAFFGAPIAHEDDPERGCRAALEITAQARDYAEKLERERGIPGFAVRVGINTGLVVVGEVGSDLRVAYTAVGDAINLAARMEQNAEPGTVLITEATHKLIAPLFETLAMPPLQVKGKDQPLSTYRLLAARPATGKVRGIPGLESPLVGRQAEMAALREALERLQAGVGGIVTITGEAGLGKSRLVAEIRKLPHVIASDPSVVASDPSVVASSPSVIASEAKQSLPDASRDCFGEKMPRNDSPLQWVEGRCLSYGTSIAYLLWLDVLRGLLGVTAEDSLERVCDILRKRLQALCPDAAERHFPYLARLMSLPLDAETESRLRNLDGQELKSHTFEAAEALLRCAAQQQPLVLVCEDLHWADPTSLELLERLLVLTDRASLLFIIAFRPDPGHGSWPLRETVRRSYRHRHTDLELRPLSAADSQTLLGNLLKVEDLPAGLRQRIIAAAEGNPFFVEEVIRGLKDSGAICRDEGTGRWQATCEVADIVIPDTLQGALLARLDRLQEDTRRVLQMAAVIGRVFLYRLLEAIALEQRDLAGHLLTLQRQEMIRERARIPELEYIFKHELTREAAYNGILKKERRAFHRQVAEALEGLFPERSEEHLGLLAYHWERAEVAERAADYLLQAGDQARALYAHQEAIGFYTRALPQLKLLNDLERTARTLTKLGLTYHTAFDYERSREAYRQASALLRQAKATGAAVVPATSEVLSIAWSEPATLDPSKAAERGSGEVIAQLFSGLFALSPEMDVLPDLACDWEVSADGRSYVFHLRDDVYWSDGVPVTAGDFEYSWKRLLNPCLGQGSADLLYEVRGAKAFHQGRQGIANEVGVRALDERTLAVELEEPTGYFLSLLTCVSTFALPRHVVERFGEAWTELPHIVTSGPFRLESWEPGRVMTFVRNPRYHGASEGNVGTVRLLLTPLSEWQRRLPLFEAGIVDAVDVVGIQQALVADVLQRNPGTRAQRTPGLGVHYLVFDVTRPPFDDARVRRAFVLSTDRRELAREVSICGFLPATGGFTPPGMPGYHQGAALPYDPHQARALLADAGYPEGHNFPEVDFLSILGPATPPMCGLVQANWRQNLGVEVPWRAREWAVYQEAIRTERPHIYVIGWSADYPDPDSFLRVAMAVNSPWRNERYQELVEEARRVRDQDQRMTLYRQAEEILADEAPIMPVDYSENLLLVQPWVKDFPSAPISEFFWQDVVIEPH